MLMEVQTSIFALVILIIIFFNFRKESKWIRSKNQFFIGMIISNITILVLKIVLPFFEGFNNGLELFIFQILIVFYYVNMMIVMAFWFLYLHYHIHQNEKKSLTLIFILSPFIVIYTFLVLLSTFFTPIFFTINNIGYVERGSYYLLMVLLFHLYIGVTLVYIGIYRKNMSKIDFYTLLLFTLPPMATGLIQYFEPTFILIWESLAISILFVFINIQSKITNIDSLTGISNRREFDKQINYLSSHKRIDQKLWAMIIDIDNFKQINDLQSHQAGDIVLKDVSKILKQSLRKDDFIARIGGDEFCVIIDSIDEVGAIDIIDRINENLSEYNKARSDIFKVDISLGYGIYDHLVHKNFLDFLEHLDRKMYENKIGGKTKTTNN
jgi:diguanylate cyclase (GGDEF)-like protein